MLTESESYLSLLRFSLQPLTQQSYIQIVKQEWVERRRTVVERAENHCIPAVRPIIESRDLIKITSLRIAWI